MGAPLELFYQLTRRDLAFPNWGPIFGFFNGVDTANVSVTTTVADWDAANGVPPDGTMFFLTNLMAQARPGLAQSVNSLFVSVSDRETGNPVTNLFGRWDTPVVNPLPMLLSQHVDIALPASRYFISARGTFDAGGAANAVDLRWAGYILPAGVFRG